MSLFGSVVNALKDPELPVKVDAVVALGSFVEAADDIAQLRPILPQLLDEFFKLMNEVESEDLVFTLETIVEKFGEEIAPYAQGLTANLAAAFWKLCAADDDKDDDDMGGAMASIGCLRAIATILESVSSLPHLYVTQLERALAHAHHAKNADPGRLRRVRGGARDRIVHDLLRARCVARDVGIVAHHGERAGDVGYSVLRERARADGQLHQSRNGDFPRASHVQERRPQAGQPRADEPGDARSRVLPRAEADGVRPAELPRTGGRHGAHDVGHRVGAPEEHQAELSQGPSRPDHRRLPVLQPHAHPRHPEQEQPHGRGALDVVSDAQPPHQGRQAQASPSRARQEGVRLGLLALLSAPTESLPAEVRAAYGQIGATLVSLLVDLKAQIAERKEMEANVDENGWPRGWGDDDDNFDEELGEDDDEGDDAPLDDETLAKLASQAKRVNPFGGRGFGDDDDDDSDDDGMLTDDENVTSPIDKVDPFISFAEMMTATSAADPAKFAALNGGLTAEQQGAAQDLMRHADVRREEMAKEEAEEERKKTERAAKLGPGAV